jgi:hypothetical protein
MFWPQPELVSDPQPEQSKSDPVMGPLVRLWTKV